MRIEPLGKDNSGNVYYYFSGMRLWRQSPTAPEIRDDSDDADSDSGLRRAPKRACNKPVNSKNNDTNSDSSSNGRSSAAPACVLEKND